MFHIFSEKKRRNITSFQIIIISFFALILLGTFLLMLPISSRQRCITSFPDAMFTATSATCVTGLVVKDTATYWSVFGQGVILALIQIGGMGVITIGLAENRLMAQEHDAELNCRASCWRHGQAYRLYF